MEYTADLPKANAIWQQAFSSNALLLLLTALICNVADANKL